MWRLRLGLLHAAGVTLLYLASVLNYEKALECSFVGITFIINNSK